MPALGAMFEEPQMRALVCLPAFEVLAPAPKQKAVENETEAATQLSFHDTPTCYAVTCALSEWLPSPLHIGCGQNNTATATATAIHTHTHKHTVTPTCCAAVTCALSEWPPQPLHWLQSITHTHNTNTATPTCYAAATCALSEWLPVPLHWLQEVVLWQQMQREGEAQRSQWLPGIECV